MQPRLHCLALIACLPLLAGCAGMISTSAGQGSGSIAPDGWKPPRATSATIFLPLNFSIRSKQPEDVLDRVGAFTDDRIYEFLSIGIRSLSQSYAFDAAAWKISLERRSDPAPEHQLRLLGYEPASIKLDYKIEARVESPQSRRLTLSDATIDQRRIVALDSHQSQNYEYRAIIDGKVTATVRKEIKDAVFFDVSLWLSVDRKSRPAADKHYGPFSSLDEKAILDFRKRIEEQLFEAYAHVFEGLGISVERRRY